MHHFDAISQKFPGEAPGPPPAGGGDPLPHPPPFGALRLSESFGFIGHLCPPPPGSGGSGSAPEQFVPFFFQTFISFFFDYTIMLRKICKFVPIHLFQGDLVLGFSIRVKGKG